MLWNSAQIFSFIWRVSVSTAHEPPAGSIGCSMPNSSCSMIWMLRAMRRENSSPLRMGSSNGALSNESMPPTTPEKISVVLRSMLTYGS